MPDGRSIYNESDRAWRVKCVSDQVYQSGGKNEVEVPAGGSARMIFHRLGKDGVVPKEKQQSLVGRSYGKAYYLGRADITVTEIGEDGNDGMKHSFVLLLVGDNTKGDNAWTPVYESKHLSHTEICVFSD